MTGNVTSGGTHIHHVVFGLVFMCVGGISGLTVQDGSSVLAALTAGLFGIGTALVLDEFALVPHLNDVYWKEQGRLSVEAIFIAAGVCGLALLGAGPLDIADSMSTDPGGFTLPMWAVVVITGINLILAAVTLPTPTSPTPRPPAPTPADERVGRLNALVGTLRCRAWDRLRRMERTGGWTIRTRPLQDGPRGGRLGCSCGSWWPRPIWWSGCRGAIPGPCATS
ncbi:hypothetical protein [Spirillospora sp. CA-294931]|uniref:hypothetical protein n=1 Tax=Spirillospora sp. CA-294931 TaxID=3240042 RepID=UPI003D9366D2